MNGEGAAGGVGGGIHFVGHDGSVLDKLPSGMERVVDPEVICSLDHGLASLTSLGAPPPHHVGQKQQQQQQQQQQRQQLDGVGGEGGRLRQPHSTLAFAAVTAAAATAGAALSAPAHKAKVGTRRPTGAAAASPVGTAAAAAAGGAGRRKKTAGAMAAEAAPMTAGPGRVGEISSSSSSSISGSGRDTAARGIRRRYLGAEGPGARAIKRKRNGDEDSGGGREGGENNGDGDGDGSGGGKAGGGDEGGGDEDGGDEDAAENPKQKAKVRNREHARNTRIRKKQYVESLKLQVGEMLQAKAREERDAELESNKILAERTTRRQMVLNMFYLTATEELSPSSWACVLDNGFTCVCPVTPFRWFPPSELREDHRLIVGIEGMIQDTASMAVFIKSICPRSRNPTGRKLNYQFYTSPEDTVVGANALMCQWLMKTDNATECGAQCEVFTHGMLRAYFSPDNRIQRLEIVFDVMGFMQQLQRAVGPGELRMIPNSLAAALQPSQQARLVMSAEPPFGITHANEAWTALMGHSEEQAKAFLFTLMNDPTEATSGGALEALVQACIGSDLKRPEMMELGVVTRDMRRLAVVVQAYPLGTSTGSVTHLLLVMEEVPICARPLPQGGMDLFPFV